MYHNTAQGLASLGRGNDSMLVHMTPREVGGLQRLAMAHGGSLTTNPKTGLPEAGFLESILPILAGGAAVALTGGAATPFLGLSEGALAALAGGATGALFGDPKRGLLMNAGLGALGGYGGGNLYSGLSAAGTAVPELTPEQIANIDKAGQTAYNTTYADEMARRANLERGYEDLFPLDSAISSVPSSPQYAYTPQQLAGEAQYAAMEGATPPPAPAKFSFSNIDAKKFIKQNALPLGMVGIPALIGSGFFKQPTLSPGTPSGNKGSYRPYTYTTGQVNPRFGQPGEPYYLGQGYTALPVYAAAAGGLTPPMQDTYPQARIGRPINTGGLPSFAQGGGTSLYAKADEMYSDTSTAVPDVSRLTNAQLALLASESDDAATMAAAQKEQFRREVIQRPAKSAYTRSGFALGGVASLPEYAAGGKLLEGPGDGMSDSIPAVIKGPKPQRAALAQGEFVIPADVVSHLGNGSTDAGAKRLYAMMDKVRHARTGNKRQGRQINPDKYMPA
jgi:hypothetical protein